MTLAFVVLTFVLGIVAGLRSMTAPAAIAWASWFGWLHLDGTWLAFLGSPGARYVLSALMIGELIADKLSFTPSRTKPGPFAGRLVTGALAGAAFVVGSRLSMPVGATVGALGAAAGTLGGYRVRAWLPPLFRVPDFVVALAEDVVAVGCALVVVSAQR